MITAEGYGTASWIEIIWTLSAVPGFILWSRSCATAKRYLSAAKRLDEPNGRLLWARFSVRLTGLMVFIELVFIIIGVIALSRVSNPSSSLLSNLIIAGGLITTSVFISLLAYQWRDVENQILELARQRRIEKEAMNMREATQNTRDTDQNLRSFRQNERDREIEGPGTTPL